MWDIVKPTGIDYTEVINHSLTALRELLLGEILQSCECVYCNKARSEITEIINRVFDAKE